MAEEARPTTPVLGVDEREDIHAFYQNTAYRTSRVHINLEKMKVLKDRVDQCVRTEGVNSIDRCDHLVRRYEAAVRVCQWGDGPNQRPRNVGNILEKERAIREQAAAEGAPVEAS